MVLVAQVFGISPACGDHFIIPPAEEMASKSVILSTLCNAGQLATAGFPPDFLTAVFVDEAGQVLTTELFGVSRRFKLSCRTCCF